MTTPASEKRRAADRLVHSVKGPFMSVKTCRACGYMEKYPRRGLGRGYGLASGGAAHNKLIKHIYACHEDILNEATENTND